MQFQSYLIEINYRMTYVQNLEKVPFPSICQHYG